MVGIAQGGRWLGKRGKFKKKKKKNRALRMDKNGIYLSFLPYFCRNVLSGNVNLERK